MNATEIYYSMDDQRRKQHNGSNYKKTARPGESSGRRDERDETFGCVDG